ncbi:heparinase II/III domain-containing protein [Bacillus sp. Au-Bac7]|uniref:heparinase II/III domain-containing protein n=1 Tax=Bacillus sp. Au-Bac7 TaxID=2906458 RepID=UPI001E3DD8F9|nr:heparinase II/III family protein [Bacillus sp. Au-Bac7]MCE4049551.1 heparinase II/III family protein [Bacillus sp. Au-Bac7]
MKFKKNQLYIVAILIISVFLYLFIQMKGTNEIYDSKKMEKDKQQNERVENPTPQEIIQDLKSNSPNKQHPRIMATENDFQKIKEDIKLDSYSKQWYETLSEDANNLLNQPLSSYEKNDGIRILSVSQTVLDRTITLSLMYQITGDWHYAERAWKELEKVSGFQDWNPSHFLDTAEMATAVAIGYDWLYDYLRPKQKAVLENAIIEKAFRPALKIYNSDQDVDGLPIFWKDATNNWNTVVNSGLIVSALAIADESSKTENISADILDNAVASIDNSLSSYAEDGGTEEGPGYWNYATKYIAYFISAMDTSLGTDYGLSTKKGLSETGYFYIYMRGPGGLFNLGDSGKDNYNNLSQLLWFSNKYSYPELAVPAMKKYNAMNLIWYKNSSNYSQDNNELPLDRYFSNIKTGTVTMRESWTNPNSIFVGIHGGDNQASHGDLDIGTFVLDAEGVRWAEELGTDNYNSPGYFQMSGKRWSYYRKGTEGQNTLVINPNTNPNQISNAVGKLSDFKTDKESSSVTVDLTKAYENATLIKRTLSLINDRKKVLLEDEVKMEKNSEVYWFMHTQANIGLSTDKKTAILVKDEKILYVKLKSPEKAKFSVLDANPLSNSATVSNSKNEGLKKLSIHLDNIQNVNIKVEFSTSDTK